MDKLLCAELSEEDRVQVALGTKKLFEVLIQISGWHSEVPAKIWDDWYTIQVCADNSTDAAFIANKKFFGEYKYGDTSLLTITHFLNMIKRGMDIRYVACEVLGDKKYSDSCTIEKQKIDSLNKLGDSLPDEDDDKYI